MRTRHNREEAKNEETERKEGRKKEREGERERESEKETVCVRVCVRVHVHVYPGERAYVCSCVCLSILRAHVRILRDNVLREREDREDREITR